MPHRESYGLKAVSYVTHRPARPMCLTVCYRYSGAVIGVVSEYDSPAVSDVIDRLARSYRRLSVCDSSRKASYLAIVQRISSSDRARAGTHSVVCGSSQAISYTCARVVPIV